MKAAALGLAVFVAIYAIVLRTWHKRWGATGAEVHATLAGDESVPGAKGQVTHAITINAPPEKVWPWLMQIGQDRSGFYSYTFLENLVGCDMPEIHELRPDWRARQAGETVWFGTPQHFHGKARMVAGLVDPPRAFVMVGLAENPEWGAGPGRKLGIRQ